MLIDDTKMTIVYELKEWIRWLFGIKDCFDLVHEKSAIHDLEDIKILTVLKVLEVQPCSMSNCIHNELYKSILNKINFYVPFNKTEVPRFFMEKVNQINQKLCNSTNNGSCLKDEVRKKGSELHYEDVNSRNDRTIQNLLNHNIPVLPNHHKTEKPTPYKLINQLNAAYKGDEDIQDDTRDCNDSISSSDPPQMYCNNRQSSSKNLNSSATNLLTDSREGKSQSEIKNFTDKCSLQKTDNEATEKTNKMYGRRRNISKPFSLAATIVALREEAKNETCVTESPHTKNSSVFNESDCANNKFIDDCLVGETDFVRKKRKRIRKRRATKKQEFTEMDKIPWESIPIKKTRFVQNSEKRPCHIRFNNSTEDEEEENESMEIVNQSSQSINLPPVTAAQTEPPSEKLVLVTHNDIESSDVAASHLTVSPEIMMENKPNVLDSSNENVSQSQVIFTNTFTCEEFESFKNQFPNPEVFKRFY
ncbi:hypothetical protein RUM43_004129 [Polyplax serrata]|uniref:Uncharacterized protein n=1 Tax=Polyplax serrata TaxID=468196 RepID=A0AAN8XPC9_POLSC